MPRKRDVPVKIYEVLVEFHRQLRLDAGKTTEQKQRLYREISENYGRRTADIAWALYEANISPNQFNQYFNGVNTVPQQNSPGSTNVTQTAGGNMTGVNATGTQANRDINIFSQDLDQSSASINANLKSALVEARRSIEAAEIDPTVKPMIVEQFDKLTDELKRGEQKNTDVVKALWNMVYGAVKSVPAAVSAIASLDKLKDMLGL